MEPIKQKRAFDFSRHRLPGRLLLWILFATLCFSPRLLARGQITQRTEQGDSAVYLPIVLRQTLHDIFFVSAHDGNPEIYTVDWDGSNQLRITNDSGPNGAPAWSPNGMKIAYLYTANLGSDLFVVNADGSGQTRLTGVGSSLSVGSFSWSPDSVHLAYSYGRGWSDIGIASASTAQQSNGAAVFGPCPFPRNISGPAWSPDGIHLAVYYAEGIGLMQVNGCEITPLTSSNEDRLFRWSPDGTQLVFDSSRDGNSEIYTINVDGSEETRLTNSSTYDGSAQWSPDGTKLMFGSQRDGNAEIYVMNRDGSDQTRLTNDPAIDYVCSWSADSKKIAFVSERADTKDIYVMNSDGSAQTRLTNNMQVSNCG